MGRRDWVWIDKNTRLRREPNGEITGQKIERIAESVEAKRELRQSGRHMEGPGGMQMIASLPRSVANEMQVRCGNDPDKQAAFLRDHQEHLVTDRRNTRLPGRTIRIFMGGGKRG